MQPDPDLPLPKANPPVGSLPPESPALPPPIISAPVRPGDSGPVSLPAAPILKTSPWRQVLAFLLSLCLALFLADAIVSLVADSLLLVFNIRALTLIRGFLFFFALFMGIMVYGLIGLTPMIPKRLFLPVTLFNPVAALVVIPFSIYFYGRIQQISWVVSLIQLFLGLTILQAVQGGFKFHWPLVAEKQIQAPGFSWRNLSLFLVVNVVVLLPAILLYLFLCASAAVAHFSDGFLALRPAGLIVQVRKYVRNDGKSVRLFPMSHVGDPAFYRELSESITTNSIVLMEGVTDHRNLLTNSISYKRMAASLGVAEQQKEFDPTRGKVVRADLDVEQFGTNTIDLLNLSMLVHVKGMNATTLLKLMQYSPPPHFEEQLLDDLLGKRNRCLLKELDSRLSESENFIVPWGAGHMPGIAKEIQKSGFRLEETRDYVAIRFRRGRNHGQTP